jgi:ATP-dependent Clp protease ATP-binding subunit ClpA
MSDAFARLTPAARAALATASQTAASLRHSQIDTVHLLLGLLADPTSAAGQALTDLRLTRVVVQASARHAVSPRTAPSDLTPATRAALRVSVAEAAHRRHPRIGTLHLLAGVLDASSPVVARALAEAKLSPPAARAAVAFLLGSAPDWLAAEEQGQ